MSADENLSPTQFTVYRGEGSHDATSAYDIMGKPELKGTFYTSDLEEAQKYAGVREEGHVYRLTAAHPDIVGPVGKHFIVKDPNVQARRVHDVEHCPGCGGS